MKRISEVTVERIRIYGFSELSDPIIPDAPIDNGSIRNCFADNQLKKGEKDGC